ncbi:MAG TPA: CHASE2 domain-containing protein, partial [Candidatus Wallbacteria bacterium]|nr:CHASE2 domain-containing protein [Candidatus Wallbacteria bacterium]
MISLVFVIVFTSCFWLYSAHKFEGFEVKLIDYNFSKRGSIAPDKHIVIVGFTDSCLVELGKWPWKRDIHSEVLTKLTEAGATVIGVDVLFQDRSPNPADDGKFIQTVKNSKKIVLSAVITSVIEYADGALTNIKRVTLPFEEIAKGAAGLGFINVNYETLNTDGILRCLPLFERIPGRDYFSFAYEIAKNSGKIPFTPSEGLHYYINYHGQNRTYEYVSFSKVYSGQLPMAYFRDKYVLVGPAATALGDLHHTPFGTMPGTEVQANILDCIVNDNFLKRFSAGQNFVLWAMIVALSLFVFVFSSIKAATILNAILLLLLLFANRFLFVKFNFILDIFPALVIIIASYFLAALVASFGKLMTTNNILHRRIRELNALYSISRNISELINLDKILKDVLDEAIKTLDTERGSLMLIDDDEQKLEVKVATGFSGSAEKRVLIPIGEGIAGKAFSDCVSIVSNSGDSDPRFKAFPALEQGVSEMPHQVRNILCVPLIMGEKKSIGVINIVNKIDNSQFTEDDVKLMETIAHHAATLIENSKLYKLATVDGMTGLYVHRYFQVRLKEEFIRSVRYDNNISVIMTDIDHFKKFNDTYGHQCGDMVLTHVAKIVRDTIRNIDIAARYGGEEFAVILPETENDGAFKLA